MSPWRLPWHGKAVLPPSQAVLVNKPIVNGRRGLCGAREASLSLIWLADENIPELPTDQCFEVVPGWICEILSPAAANKDREIKMLVCYSRNITRR